MRKIPEFKSAALSLLLGFSAGCTTVSTAVAEDNQTLPKASQPGFASITQDCILTPDPRREKTGSETTGLIGGLVIALADAAIPAVTSFVFDRIASKAKADTMARTASTTAKSTREADDNLYGFKGSNLALGFGCVTFVRPSTNENPPDPAYRALFDAAFEKDWKTNLVANMPGVSTDEAWYPELLAEFRVEPAQAVNSSGEIVNIGFHLEPVSIAYGATGAAKTGKENKKDVALNISVSGFLADGKNGLVDKEIYSNQFSFPDLTVGTVFRVAEKSLESSPTEFEKRIVPAQLAGRSGPVVPLPQSNYKIELNGQTQQLQTLIPLQATVIVTEFEEGGDLQRAIIKAIEEDKDKFTGPIDEALKSLVKSAVGEDDGDGS